MQPERSRSVFVAYSSSSPLRAETMRHAASALTRRGLPAKSWEDLQVGGRGLIDTVLAAIDGTEIFVAEVSDMNNNVLFELGYAIASEKQIVIAFDETDSGAHDLWRRIGLLSNVGRLNYGGNAESLANQLFSSVEESADLLATLLAGGPSMDPSGLFAPLPPVRTQPVEVLAKLLERQSSLRLYAASEELGIAPLDFYVKMAYRSAAAVFHLLGSQRVHATEHNARASLLAGFAVGFGLPTLIVAEAPFKSPLDYKDLLFAYQTASALSSKVETWLRALPTDETTRRKMGKLQLHVDLPIQSFGQYVAENERGELGAYYVDTRELHAVIAGESRVFVGRKGTGKTATMTQAVSELRLDRSNLVVPIKPTAYELAGVIRLVDEFGVENRDYALISTWLYLLYTEIASRALKFVEEGPKGVDSSPAAAELRRLTSELNFAPEDDISDRLEKAVGRLLSEAHRAGESTHDFVSRNLQLHKLPALNAALTDVLGGVNRVCLLVDNLDKTWEAGADHKAISQFILSLLVASGRVENEFGRSMSGSHAIDVTLTAFLRTDIFDHVVSYAREPDKISPLHIEWRDQELLERVLVERYAAKRMRKTAPAAQSELWHAVFAPEVKGLPTRDYVFWRALQRPRDIIYFANAALTTAINRKHAQVLETDMVHAEVDYSRFAVEALLVESQAEQFDLEEVLYEFVGADAILTETDVDAIVGALSDPGPIKSWLVSSSFLGVEVRAGDFRHVEGESEARKQLKLAAKLQKSRNGSGVLFRVHPAFRPYLEIQDTDLHQS